MEPVDGGRFGESRPFVAAPCKVGPARGPGVKEIPPFAETEQLLAEDFGRWMRSTAAESLLRQPQLAPDCGTHSPGLSALNGEAYASDIVDEPHLRMLIHS